MICGNRDGGINYDKAETDMVRICTVVYKAHRHIGALMLACTGMQPALPGACSERWICRPSAGVRCSIVPIPLLCTGTIMVMYSGIMR